MLLASVLSKFNIILGHVKNRGETMACLLILLRKCDSQKVDEMAQHVESQQYVELFSHHLTQKNNTSSPCYLASSLLVPDCVLFS